MSFTLEDSIWVTVCLEADIYYQSLVTSGKTFCLSETFTETFKLKLINYWSLIALSANRDLIQRLN